MSIHMSIPVSIYMSVPMSIHMSIPVSIYMSVPMSIHMSILMSTHMPIADQGNAYIQTKKIYTRPVDIRAVIRLGELTPECGVVNLFPQTSARHSGYNAGVGWWKKYFGAGIDKSIKKRGSSGDLSRWQTVRINARKNGWVLFYLNGKLRYRLKSRRYQKGKIRLGMGCRKFEMKRLTVRGGRPKSSKCASKVWWQCLSAKHEGMPRQRRSTSICATPCHALPHQVGPRRTAPQHTTSECNSTPNQVHAVPCVPRRATSCHGRNDTSWLAAMLRAVPLHAMPCQA